MVTEGGKDVRAFSIVRSIVLYCIASCIEQPPAL